MCTCHFNIWPVLVFSPIFCKVIMLTSLMILIHPCTTTVSTICIVQRKFARRWFGPYVVASTNDNTTYHLAELDVTRIEVPVAGKRIKFFKKRHKVEPDPEMEDKDSDKDGEPDEGRTDDNSEEDE